MDGRFDLGGSSSAEAVATTPARRLPIANALLFLATLGTTTVAGSFFTGVDFAHDAGVLARGLPYAAALLAILLAHESGHYLMCRRHGVDASLPYFLPAPPFVIFGTFGAFIRIRSRFPDRRALFDIGAAGPWAGFVVAVVVYVVGLRLSTISLITPTAPPGGFIIENGDSLLTAFLTRLVLGVDPSVVDIHPVAIAGWFGLFVTSLNLLPVGQLDGGHALYAATGRRTQLVPALLIATVVWLGLRGWFGWLVWALLLSVVLSLGHPPTRDDRLPLGGIRQLAAFATVVLFVVTFVPEPFRILE